MRATIRFFLVVILLAPAVAGAGVTVEYAKSADFTKYRTFSWIEGTPAADEVVDKKLRAKVTEELRQRGLQLLSTGGDLLVRTHVNAREERRQEIDIMGERGYWQSDVTEVTPTGEVTRQVGIGTVVVELLDADSKLQVWQGVIGQVPQPAGGRRSEQQFDRAVEKLLKSFPPP